MQDHIKLPKDELTIKIKSKDKKEESKYEKLQQHIRKNNNRKAGH